MRFADALLQDGRLAVRALSRRPAFAIVSIVTLALGVGANTAVFSAVYGVLLRPLPYSEPDRIVRVFEYHRLRGFDFGTIAYPNFGDWRERARSFASMAAYDEYQPLVTGEEGTERLPGASVSASFFDVLGMRPAVGRFFLPEEDVPGSARSVVLSHGYWTRRYGADPSVVGSAIELNGFPYTIVGIAPQQFEDPGLSGRSFEPPALWRVSPSYFGSASRSGRSFTAIARLARGVTTAQANAEMESLSRALAGEYPDANANRAAFVRPLIDDLVGEARTPLAVLLAAAGLVLLIACANVANLSLVRAADGHRDTLLRTALGASRGRLVAGSLIESGLLAGLGGLAGAAVAYWGTGVLRVLAGDHVPRVENIVVDVRVLGFAAAATALAGLLFGMVPALATARTDLAGGLREGSAGAGVGRGRRRLQRALVVAEVALSTMLLIGGGLLVRSLTALQSVHPGLQPEGVLTLVFDPPANDYDSTASITSLLREVETSLASVPGVRAAGLVNILPMSGSFNGMGVRIDARPEPPPGEGLSAETRAVTSGFLTAIGIPVLRGRGILPTDRADAAPVAVINATMAQAFWPGADPIGARITIADRSREVVGIVGDVHEFTLAEAPVPTVYLPHEQALDWMRIPAQVVVAAERGDAPSLAPAVRRALLRVEPAAGLSQLRPMEAVVSGTLREPRFRTTLVAAFGFIAFVLGAVGIYGVVARGVTQRSREIGIRMSLGAARSNVRRLVLREGLRPVALGLILGILAALPVGTLLSGLLFEVGPRDPMTFLTVPMLLAAVGIAACWLPARRATRVDPVDVLRGE